MKFFSTVRGLILGALVVCSAATNAAVIEFGSSVANPFSFNFRTFDNVVGDIDLVVTAGVFSDNSSEITLAGIGEENRRFGLENNDGLGVRGLSGEDDNTDIDGQNRNDIVIFTFSEQVSFLGLEFDNVDSNDDFEFGLVNGDIFNRFLSNEDITTDFFALSSGLVGTSFAVGAVGSNDNFTISSITVVPEPSTIAIFSLGLIGLLRLRSA